MMGIRVPLFKLEGSPCHECLIKITCSKSFLLNTACDKYKDFINTLVEFVGNEQKDFNED